MTGVREDKEGKEEGEGCRVTGADDGLRVG